MKLCIKSRYVCMSGLVLGNDICTPLPKSANEYRGYVFVEHVRIKLWAEEGTSEDENYEEWKNYIYTTYCTYTCPEGWNRRCSVSISLVFLQPFYKLTPWVVDEYRCLFSSTTTSTFKWWQTLLLLFCCTSLKKTITNFQVHCQKVLHYNAIW